MLKKLLGMTVEVKFINHWDDMMEDIGEEEYNKREAEVHELLLFKIRGHTKQMAREMDDDYKEQVDPANQNLGVIWKIMTEYFMNYFLSGNIINYN